MIRRRATSFRTLLILQVVVASVVTLLISGSLIYLIRRSATDRETRIVAQDTARDLAGRTEALLAGVEQILFPLLESSRLLDAPEFAAIVQSTLPRQPLVRAIHFLDDQGVTFAVGTTDGRWPFDDDLIGIDFSNTPLYREIREERRPYWSDKFISAFSGDTSVGVALRIGDASAIAEVSLASLLGTVQAVASSASGIGVRLMAVDRRGELVADSSGTPASGVVNLLGLPEFYSAFHGEPLPAIVRWEEKTYSPAAAWSEELGWIFMVGVPAGPDNPANQQTLLDLLLVSASFLFIAIVLAPFWSRTISRDVERLQVQADEIADGRGPQRARSGYIREFNQLESNLHLMAGKILERERALQELNADLERRVRDRTTALEVSNRELRRTLDDLERVQDVLIRSEKLAALGRLVAGVAHELNTPIGNALMVVTSIRDEIAQFRRGLDSGLTRSELERRLTDEETGLEIAERNLSRAAELVTSFKHVASDQTSAVRRTFVVSEVVDEVLMTLNPMIKRSPHTVNTALEDGVEMDSYPGVLGQILTNLVTNAMRHAWDEGEGGTITVTTRSEETTHGDHSPMVVLSVSDDGKGIPEEIGMKIFDPFFTTQMGGEGTGLGLNIAHNAARNVLGGDLDFTSSPGEGTVFILTMPASAPEIIRPGGVP